MNVSKIMTDGEVEYKCGFCLKRFDTRAEAEKHCSNLTSGPDRQYERPKPPQTERAGTKRPDLDLLLGDRRETY